MGQGMLDGNSADEAPQAISRRSFVVGALACALSACLPAAARAWGDEPSAGVLTVSGVPSIEESQAFASLAEALAAVSACDPSLFEGVAGYTVYVHGAVEVPACALEAGGFDDGLACAVVGADAGASLSCEAGFSLGNATGALILRGLACTGRPALSCRDSLTIDSCSFYGGAACAAGGDVAVTGCSFSTASGAGGSALEAALTGSWPLLTFSSSSVSGFACAIGASCGPAETSASVSVTSNSVVLAPAEDEAGERTSVVRLSGGPWPQSCLLLDGNAVLSGGALVCLDSTFQAQVPGYGAQSVASGDLDASAVVGLFEYDGIATSSLPEGLVPVVLSPASDVGGVAAAVNEANAALMPGSAPSQDAAATTGTYTVSYDPNGALAGSAPDAATVEAGSAVAVEGMGSLALAGAVFQGWNTSPDGTGVFYAAGQVFVPTSDTVLYAQWSSTGTVANVQMASPAAA